MLPLIFMGVEIIVFDNNVLNIDLEYNIVYISIVSISYNCHMCQHTFRTGSSFPSVYLWVCPIHTVGFISLYPY